MWSRTTVGVLVALVAVAACGEPADPPEGTPAPEQEGGDVAAGQESVAPRPGSFEITVTADRTTTLSGDATFTVRGADLAIRLDSEGADRFLEVEGRQVLEVAPVAGTVELGRLDEGETGWSAILVDRSEGADNGERRHVATSGALTLTSVAPERLAGEISFSASDPASDDAVWVSGTFDARCDTDGEGPGACW